MKIYTNHQLIKDKVAGSSFIISPITSFTIDVNKPLYFDIETTGLDPYTNTITLVSITDGSEVHIIMQDLVQDLVQYLNQTVCTLVAHNAKFDFKFLYHAGLNFNHNIQCTMLQEKLINNTDIKGQNSLDKLVLKYCHKVLPKTLQKAWINLPYYNVTLDMLNYAAGDILYLKQIYNIHLKEIEAKELHKIIAFENSFLKYLTIIELNGFKLDVVKWNDNIENKQCCKDALFLQLQDELKAKNIDQKFNYNSPQQLIKVLSETYDYTLPLDSKTGRETTAKDKLKRLEKTEKDNNNFKDLILDLKGVSKTIQSFAGTYLDAVNPVTKRLHSNFNQVLTTTRMSSSKPNLQNLPKVAEIRECFVAEPDYDLITADYSSQEVIILADFADEHVLINMYKNGQNIHLYNANIIYSYLNSDGVILTEDNYRDIKFNSKLNYRDIAKTTTFKMAYGGTAYTLKQDLECSETVAENIIEAITKAYPAQTAFQEKWQNFALRFGWFPLNAELGTKYFFNKFEEFVDEIESCGYYIHSVHKNICKKYNSNYLDDEGVKPLKKKWNSYMRFAKNYPIQATGAHIMKNAIMLIQDYIMTNKIDARIVNTVHDELIVEAHKSISNDFAKEVERLMVDAARPFISSCTIRVEYKVSPHWEK